MSVWELHGFSLGGQGLSEQGGRPTPTCCNVFVLNNSLILWFALFCREKS